MHDPSNPRGQYTGYVNMRSLSRIKSFKRKENICLYKWTHFLFKVKGDGRTYTIILNTPGQSNLTANNVHTYALFTRGGPYWQ
jgi:NADH dehydrogenase [ubiquinone] 1 alpha subcomplex assembly factor 1